MLEKQNQGPQCTACGSPMKLSAIEPSSTGQDLRTFTCPICRRVQVHIIESLVTEAWLGPQRAIKGRQQNAVTHAIEGGRMVPKKAH
jgi:hypothetical protein